MSRLKKLFETKNKNVLNIYFTAGYPRLQSTIPIMQALQKSNVDIIELGLAYSDPLADGEINQQSSAVALANGMTLKVLFQQLKGFRNGEIGDKIPVVLMGYMNQYNHKLI